MFIVLVCLSDFVNCLLELTSLMTLMYVFDFFFSYNLIYFKICSLIFVRVCLSSVNVSKVVGGGMFCLFLWFDTVYVHYTVIVIYRQPRPIQLLSKLIANVWL